MEKKSRNNIHHDEKLASHILAKITKTTLGPLGVKGGCVYSILLQNQACHIPIEVHF
jgi:hypothetical protein